MRTALGIIVGLLVGATGVALFGWLLWWLWNRDEEEIAAIEIVAEPLSPALEQEAGPLEFEEEEKAAGKRAQPVKEDSEPDDLRRIEGIGPKIASVLSEAGISTYALLADADADRLERILGDADPRLLRLADPTTWPEQAALAAAGQWDALEALQSRLKGGRRA